MINMTQWDAHMSQYHKGCTAMNVPTSAIVIIAETQWAGSQKVPLSWDQRKVLFEQCPESTIKDYHSRRCDPVLCLFDGCPLMGVENEDVEHGIANGTRLLGDLWHHRTALTKQQAASSRTVFYIGK
jgi:hypothetical protein